MPGLQLSGDYNKRVGETLRAIRRLHKMSLQEVECSSNQEFKASILGAYERGERAISVPRLWCLARFYGVEVTQLLPLDEPALAVDGGVACGVDSPLGNLVENLDLSDSEAKVLKRFIFTIAAALEAGSGPSPGELNQGCR